MRPTGFDICPTTDERKGKELRVPAKLIIESFQGSPKLLELIIQLKMEGSRIESNEFFCGVPKSTTTRYIKQLQDLQWVGFDGTYLFPRAWSRIGYKKKRGMYIETIPKNLSEYLFTYSLQLITKRETRTRARKRGSAKPKGEGLPVRYYTNTLNISERTFFRKLKAAKKAGLLIAKPQNTKIGLSKDYESFRKNLHGIPVFKKGSFTVIPGPSVYKFNLA